MASYSAVSGPARPVHSIDKQANERCELDRDAEPVATARGCGWEAVTPL